MALLENKDLNLWLGEGRHVMTYCISGGETFNLVLSHPDTSDPSTWSTDRQDILAEMRRNYEGWDPTYVRQTHM
jgi:salicylate hydroxylase